MADDSKEPYGSVTYADPGYQKDGVKRYPIDTEAHCRAAWSYINQADNAAKYSSEHLAAIKGRIKAAAKKFGINITDEDTADHHSSMHRSSGLLMVETRNVGRVDNVDFAQRLITVLTMPYEEMAEIAYRQEMWREVFSRNAFEGIEVENRRIPVNREHNPQLFCGKMMTSQNRDEGLITELRISRTELGDETLRMAADDDLAASAGFFLRSNSDQRLDRVNRIRRINRASLDHIALTGAPAYAGTKVLAVRNSEDSEEAHLPELTSTPNMDKYLNDPVLQWAADAVLD